MSDKRKYRVEKTVTFTFDIEADSEKEAEDKAMYINENKVNAYDYSVYNIEIEEIK
jgi:hypothetical protein